MKKRLFALMVLVLVVLSPGTTWARMCIAANDFGLGGLVYVYANPDEDLGEKGKTRLIKDKPLDAQVAPWVASGLMTTGVPKDPTGKNKKKGVLKAYVQGSWAPWGGKAENQSGCPIRNCRKNDSGDAICLDDGKKVEVGSAWRNVVCKLSDRSKGGGWGLYGLIAIERDGKTYDPNEKGFGLTLPSNLFRTFRMSPLVSDADGQHFKIDVTEQCQEESGSTVCVADKNNDGEDIVARGELFFKIYDNHYYDNTGVYVVNVVSGVFVPKGFIQISIEAFRDNMMKISEKLFTNLTEDLGLINIVRSLLVFYIAFTGLAFMLGFVQIKQSELIVRLFKVGVIVALISPGSWDFFNNYLFRFFTDGAESIANIIIDATLYYNEDHDSPRFAMPEDASALSVFDSLVKMLTSRPVHAKTWALLFYDWKLFYIPFIYVCLVFVALGIIRSVLLYVTAIVIIALLLVIAPIFLVMILFQLTKQLFDAWLKQLMSSAMMMIVVSASIALMVTLILGELEKLLYYRVCWQSVWNPIVLGVEIIDLWFWYPDAGHQVDKALTAAHFFGFLFVCLLLNAFMQQIPHMIDALSNAALRPISTMYSGAAGAAGGVWARTGGQAFAYARAVGTPGAALMLSSKARDAVKTAAGMANRAEAKVKKHYGKVAGESSAAPDTQGFKWARDKVGGAYDTTKSAVKQEGHKLTGNVFKKPPKDEDF